jgi:membrane associated rhomboid family serine protease
LPIFVYFTIIEVPAFVFLILWFALQFFSGAFSLLGDSSGAGIAWWAHVGGFAFGFLTAKLFEKRGANLPSADVAPLVRRMWR